METNYIWSYSFPMKKGLFDDDYYFFEDGHIIHSYDKTQNKLNIEEIVLPESIDLEKRKTMLLACPKEKYETIKHLLNL